MLSTTIAIVYDNNLKIKVLIQELSINVNQQSKHKILLWTNRIKDGDQ